VSSEVRVEVLDLEFQGTPGVIAAHLLMGPEGPVLIETGPASTLPTLRRRLEDFGLRPADVRHVLVTHIHLDHAGAAGWWASQGATVYVHPLGAPHLIDPGKLLKSAGRIYGDRMESLWGETVPAPADRVVAVDDREVIEAGGLQITALDTPGHARHHHVYRLGDVAFTGDAAGIRLPLSPWIDLPAPPPEFDLEAWEETLERLRREELTMIYPTHFGPSPEVKSHLDTLEALLEETVAYVRGLLDEGADRETTLERYSGWMRERAAAFGVDERMFPSYELANPRAMSVDGITRYWRKREGVRRERRE
jgi:glyoxylase-like metal-dependent hydrolase (beta-lactamase superfamily II)